MPKQKITREMILDAAFALAREGGMERVLVKEIAAQLGCSVQPIYFYFQNMEQLKSEIIQLAGTFLREYVEVHIDPDHLFESTGMAYAQFAQEEPHLYRLYFLRPRENAVSFASIFATEADPAVAQAIAKQLRIPLAQAKCLHMHMLIYNTGLSFLLTTLGENAIPEQAHALAGHAYAAFASYIYNHQEEMQ